MYYKEISVTDMTGDNNQKMFIFVLNGFTNRHVYDRKAI